ncbi:MAG: TonB-dependent receptor [Aquidulcibacter sp.]|jgi:iron complex outermembrane receptor protein|uniref:TonB-dependent receptor n=1 Tax=Aquidulcibacter sp. TaxID=2052990 RepID=UPI0022BC84A3|nr:TonB-dependent receptor [Aquidulcibacter sp.]MCE2892235.1 TonB-dependent receptor [Hyphomonadaceae bacterium]MCZ8209631.1 TonB-dependent receptor [Aquidulcibacter sp.]
MGHLNLMSSCRRDVLCTAIAVFASLMQANPALAQSASQTVGEPGLADTVETIVVTAARVGVPRSALPSTIQIISPQETRIQTQIGGSAIDAVAALVPSFSPTRQKMSGAGETLRGRSPLFLIDGVPQSTPLRDGSRDGFTIDPFFVDRVEVIFGSNAIQGVGAAGGVINYVTARPAAVSEGWSGAALAQASFAGSFENDGTGGKVAARAGRDFGAFDVMLGAAFETRGAFYDGDGRRIGVDGTQGELQDSTSWSVFSKVGLALGETRHLEGMVNYFELAGDNSYVVVAGSRATGVPTSSVRGTQTGVAPVNYAWTGSLSYRDTAVFGGTLTAQAFFTDFESVFGGGVFADFQDPRIDPTRNLFDQSSNLSDKQGFKLDWSGPVSFVRGLRLTAGLDGLRDESQQELIATDRPWVPPTTYTALSPFVQLNQALLDGRLNLAVGIRQESATVEIPTYDTLFFYGPQRVDGGKPEFRETLVNAGATFELVEGFTAYASYAEGFTMADIGRITRAVTRSGQDVDTFLDISPVISSNTEVGLELDAGPIRASLAHFWSNSDKGALLVLRAGDIYEVQRQRTEISGFDLNIRARTPIEGLNVQVAASALIGKTDNNGDGSVETDMTGPNIAPDRVLIAADWARGPWTARVQYQIYSGRTFTGIGLDARNDFEGYTLTDAFVRRTFRDWSVSLSASNLFDEQYISYNSDTERPTDNLRFFAGRGRAISLQVERRF